MQSQTNLNEEHLVLCTSDKMTESKETRTVVVRNWQAIDLEGILPEHEAELVITSKGHYTFDCFCGASNSGNLYSLDPVDPVIKCGYPAHAIEGYGISARGILEEFHEQRRPMVYALKKEEREV